jgi:hypothetical protein
MMLIKKLRLFLPPGPCLFQFTICGDTLRGSRVKSVKYCTYTKNILINAVWNIGYTY